MIPVSWRFLIRPPGRRTGGRLPTLRPVSASHQSILIVDYLPVISQPPGPLCLHLSDCNRACCRSHVTAPLQLPTNSDDSQASQSILLCVALKAPPLVAVRVSSAVHQRWRRESAASANLHHRTWIPPSHGCPFHLKFAQGRRLPPQRPPTGPLDLSSSNLRRLIGAGQLVMPQLQRRCSMLPRTLPLDPLGSHHSSPPHRPPLCARATRPRVVIASAPTDRKPSAPVPGRSGPGGGSPRLKALKHRSKVVRSLKPHRCPDLPAPTLVRTQQAPPPPHRIRACSATALSNRLSRPAAGGRIPPEQAGRMARRKELYARCLARGRRVVQTSCTIGEI